jgi:hypothetical protein
MLQAPPTDKLVAGRSSSVGPSSGDSRGDRRNLPCPCGSGRKLKRCCLERITRLQRIERLSGIFSGDGISVDHPLCVAYNAALDASCRAGDPVPLIAKAAGLHPSSVYQRRKRVTRRDMRAAA